MDNNIIDKLQSYNFKVNSKGIISKYSQRARRYEVAGQINNAGVYFHAQNVPPFKQGQNTLKDIFGENINYTYTPIVKEKEVEHSFSFDDYKKTTQSNNQFLIYLKAFHKQKLSKELTINLYDVRGVKSGYMENATLFPYINYDNDFVTAKIVKYNSNTGKRLKEKYSNSWFHSYKEIKNELNIKGKVSKSINCFFGEHLLNGNDKPVVIVEAEKTAILLSTVFKDIVFIASGGLAKLKGLDYSFLADRQVFLFPDNNASEWLEIAAARSWWVSDVLENEAEKGEDAADYLTNYKDDKRGGIWSKLYEQLWNINAGEITTKDIIGISLNFEHKKELSFNYCLPIPKDAGLNYYLDNAKGQTFKGVNFLMYEEEFKVLNANIDFNKTYKNEFGQWQQIDAKEFLKRLEKCFRIVKHLNSDKDYLKLFSKVLYNLIVKSNHTFNISYVERVLLPLWNSDLNNITKYFKFRNWRFASSDVINKKEFQSRLYEDKKIFTINTYLKKLQPLLDKNEFILPEYIGLHHKVGNEYIYDLIKRYNKNVLGCSTFRNYQSKLKVSKYLNWTVEKTNELDTNAKLYIKFDSTYYNSNIGCQEICTIYKIPPILTINENTGVHRKIINEYFNFKIDKDYLIDLKEEVNYFISNAQDFKFERSNGRISAICDIEKFNSRNKTKETVLMECKEAFNYELDLKDSVLNISEADAMQQNTNFLSSWIFLNNPQLTEIEKDYVKQCPMYFLNEKNSILIAS